jgi:hypothetical protein
VLQGVTIGTDAGKILIPDLLVDFRNFFSLSVGQLRFQIDQGQISRLCYLMAPYRDHLQSRAANYMSRVPLDPPHQIA